MKTMLIAGAALLLAGTAGSAIAREHAKPSADRNGDGQVSLQERQDERVSRLMRWDRDGDGRISRAEYGVFEQRRAARQGQMGQAQGQGQMRQGQEQGYGARGAGPRGGGRDLFAKLDRDGDGFVTVGEIRDRLARKYARSDNAPRYDERMPAPESAPR
jgi:hypothetical protein